MRWAESVNELDFKLQGLVGDTLIAAASVAYIGPFTAKYRRDLVHQWVDLCKTSDIPITKNYNLIKNTVDAHQVGSIRMKLIFIPPANFVCGGYTVFTLSVRPCVRPSVTFCFLNILKSNCWIFIKPCKHVHICKTNTLDKKVRARGQFY